MTRNVGLTLLGGAILAVLAIGFRIEKNRHFDAPANYVSLPVYLGNTTHWKTYNSDTYGLTFKYPVNYFLTPNSAADRIALRQNTYTAAECKTLGKRIGIRLYRIGDISSIDSLRLTKETTLGDIQEHRQAEKHSSQVRQTTYRRGIYGQDFLICVMCAPGEAPWLTGGIYEVEIYAIYETGDGGRVLLKMSNSSGGTPHTGDRALRRDMLYILHTLRWYQRPGPHVVEQE
jgi:hypothetical protein